MCRIVAGLCFFLIAGVFSATGHDSPTHRIEALGNRIESEGISAELLIDRAFEHNALGDWRNAVADFEAVLRFSPGSWTALAGCAKAYLNLGEWERTASFAMEGIELQDDPSEKAPFYALLAQARMKQKNWLNALEAWRGALISSNPQIDWFLGESETLRHLRKYDQQVEALAKARQRNPSVVLRRAWIQALVDTGDFEKASIEIERGMSQSRWQSFWLLLRAQIHGQNQEYHEQRADAATAFAEIKSRSSAEHPDPYLMMEAARALAILGERDEALDYVEKARRLGVPEDDLTALVSLID